MLWMLFAIPVSILVGYITSILVQYARAVEMKFRLKYIISGILLIILVFGIWKTSGSQKYCVNTAMWGPGGGLMAKNEVEGYVWLKQNLPYNTKVFTFIGKHIVRIHGLDMYSCDWCPDVIEFRKSTINKTPEEIHNFLKKEQYEYAIIDAHYAEKYGANENKDLIM